MEFSRHTSKSEKRAIKKWHDSRSGKPKKKKVTAPKRAPLKMILKNAGINVTPSPAEDRIRAILNGFKFPFHYEVSFAGCCSKKGGLLRFDFYIPKYRIAIEYNGKDWHVDADVKERDRIKKEFCKLNGIRLHTYKACHWENLETEIITMLTKAECRQHTKQ